MNKNELCERKAELELEIAETTAKIEAFEDPDRLAKALFSTVYPYHNWPHTYIQEAWRKAATTARELVTEELRRDCGIGLNALIEVAKSDPARPTRNILEAVGCAIEGDTVRVPMIPRLRPTDKEIKAKWDELIRRFDSASAEDAIDLANWSLDYGDQH